MADHGIVAEFDRNWGKVMMPVDSSRFVYISRKRQGIVKSVEAGSFVAAEQTTHDSSVTIRKFHSYLAIRYRVGIGPSLSKDTGNLQGPSFAPGRQCHEYN